MIRATLKARQNHKGNLELSVVLEDGKILSVPKAGRCSDHELLQANDKSIEISRGDDGSLLEIRCEGKVLFQKQGAVPVAARQGHHSGTAPRPNQNARSQQRSLAQDQELQTVSQQRAKHALDSVRKWVNCPESDQKKILSYVNNLGPMVLMSGFGQACAFYKSKGENHDVVLNALADWLSGANGCFASKNLLDEITSCSADTYQLAQAEALAYLDWLKKFARAYLKSEEDNNGAAPA